MTENVHAESCSEVISNWWHDRTKNVLLIAGIASVVVYGLGDLVSGLLYEGYSYRDQAISELSAFGSPVLPLMVAVIPIHGLLVQTFGAGIWRFADRKSLRWAGLMLIGAGAVGFPTHTIFAMSSRGLKAGFNDTIHIILPAVSSIFVFAAIVFSAVTYRGGIRLYSSATLSVLVGIGGEASMAIRGIAQNSTSCAGGFERINAYTYFGWLVVLALTMMRRSGDSAPA